MPRKLYKNIEDAPVLETPPGAGEPQSAKEKALARMAETKRNVKKHVAEGREASKRRAKEPSIVMSEMSDVEAEALSHELEADFEAASDRFIEAEEKLRAEPSIENAKAVEMAREEAQALHDASEQALPEGGKRRKSKATEVREETSVLEAEKADNLKRMQEMGGVWGGEAYFVLSERNEEIDAKLNKLKGRAPKREKAEPKAEEVLPATEESFVMTDLTPEDRVADARKTIDFMNAYEQEIAGRQKAVRAELKKHGIKDAAQIDDVLSEMSPELREKSIGLDPGLWYKIRKMARNLAGMERPPEVKQLLQKYAELENEMNEQLHKRREAEAELAAAHALAGTTPMRRVLGSAQIRSMERRANITNPYKEGVGLDFTALGNMLPATAGQMRVEQEMESLGHIEQGSLQKELAAVRALKTLEEEIQDNMLNFAGRKEAIDHEDVKMYKEKLEALHQRLRNLDESAGKSPDALAALQNAEGAYAQYRRLVTQATAEYDRSQDQARAAFNESVQAADRQSKRERDAGRNQPMSVIGNRGGEYGSYGASKADRRVVRLSKNETSDSYDRRKSSEQREAEELREKVNKEVQNYRSIKWRKELIDSINQNEGVRSVMHNLYDAFKARAIALQNEGADLGQLQTSPDPALDYALNLYRLHAVKADGKFIYGDQLRDAAAGALIEAEEVLGGDWDGAGFDQRMKEAVKPAPEKVAPKAAAAQSEKSLAGIPEELVARLSDDLKQEVEAASFVYRLLNRQERGSFTKPWALKQIMRRLKNKDESKAERLYEIFMPEEEAEPIPLTRVKRARSEAEMEKEEELDIPITVEMPETEAVKWFKNGAEEIGSSEDPGYLRKGGWVKRSNGEYMQAEYAVLSGDYVTVLFNRPEKKKNSAASKAIPAAEYMQWQLDAEASAKDDAPSLQELAAMNQAEAPAKRTDEDLISMQAPEAKVEIDQSEDPTRNKKVERALNQGEKFNMLEALNGKYLALNPGQRDRLKELFGKKWMEGYVAAYDNYRQAEPSSEEARDMRGLLEEANDILNVENPKELLAGESAAVQKEVKSATKRAEKQMAKQAEEESRSAAQSSAAASQKPREVLTMTQILENVTKNKASQKPSPGEVIAYEEFKKAQANRKKKKKQA